MKKAIWNNQVIAQSDSTIVIEGNVYFPASSVNKEFVKSSSTTSSCPWKGKAQYYDVIVNDEVNSDAAWYYSQPKEKASQIKNYVAFWKGVEIA